MTDEVQSRESPDATKVRSTQDCLTITKSNYSTYSVILIPIVVILCQVANIELQLHCVIPRISTRLGANSIRSDPVARLVLPLPPPKSVLRL